MEQPSVLCAKWTELCKF